MEESLEYNGEIAMVARWAQELLSYHFSVIHRPAQMIMDVDGLTRRFDSLPSQYAHIASLLSTMDRQARPDVYTDSISGYSLASKVPSDPGNNNSFPPILTGSTIIGYHNATIPTPGSDDIAPVTIISSISIMLHFAIPFAPLSSTCDIKNDSVIWKMTTLASDIIINWLCVDDVCGSFLAWSMSANY